MTEHEAVRCWLERHAAVVPPDADRGAAREIRPSFALRPQDRARRPIHDRIRHLGRADLPRRLRRRGCRPSCPTRSETMSSAWSARISRRSSSGSRRSTWARPAARSTRSSRVVWRDPFFGIFLNPGHQIHLDEWVNSPVWPGSPIELRSGMALQVDIIPATGTSYFTTNIEDGIALADENSARSAGPRLPADVAAHHGAARVHGKQPGHQPPSGRAAAVQSDRLPAALPPPAGSRHDRCLSRPAAS